MVKMSVIDMEVFGNRLMSVTDEMSTSLIKSSFSTNIKERKDCSVGLFDAAGRLIAQASNIPLHLGSLKGSVEAVLTNFPLEEINDGDAFVCNDPYLAGGTHTPDISVVTPVFYDGVLRFFSANIGHHTDVGGPNPGSTGPALKSIFSEGLRIPVIKLMRDGEIDQRLLHLIANNSRDPMERELDLKVQAATNEIGRRALCQLMKRDGVGPVLDGLESLISYTRTRLAHVIEDLPDGSYSADAYMDHDGLGGEKQKIAVTVIINDDRLTFDFDGTSRQAGGGYNVPENALHATCFYAVKAMLDPELPANAGMFDVIGISAPQGSMLNPEFPAATGSRSATCQKIARAIFLALGKALPEEKIAAPSADMNAALVFSGPRLNGSGLFVYLETVAGGAGACSNRDGFDAVQVHITNTSNLPAEAMELEYPLLVKEYSLAEGSAGAGRWRGGTGIIREIIATHDGVVATARSDGMSTPADGLNGGGIGGPARLGLRDQKGKLTYTGEDITNITLQKNSSIRLETPGGGGFGPMVERPAEVQKADRRDGLVFRD